MLENGLIFARFLHYAAVMALFGGALFPLYAYPSRADPEPARLSIWLRPILCALALAAFVSAVLWLSLVTASMAGSTSAATDPDALQSVLAETLFGQVWAMRLALSGLLVGLTVLSYVAPSNRSNRAAATALLAAALLATLAGTGHTMHSEGISRDIHIASDAVHLLAAGAWFGGLIALGYVLRTATPDTKAVLHRFSGMGYAAVAALVGSGLINGWFLVGSFVNLFAQPYGQLLLVKIMLFAAMLSLALANRFWLMPALSREPSQAVVAETRLRRHVSVELAIGVLVIMIVSLLGTLEPAVGH